MSRAERETGPGPEVETGLAGRPISVSASFAPPKPGDVIPLAASCLLNPGEY